MSTRRRLSAGESREAAIAAAHALLVEDGPQALTLKAVAARIGRTHANLLHHFGSAAGLQQALAEHMADGIVARIAEAFEAARAGVIEPRAAVDLAFDAFGRDGAALAGWAVLSRQPAVLDPAVRAVRGLVDRLAGTFVETPVAPLALLVAVAAVGDGLVGGALADALGMPADTVRTLVTDQIVARAGLGNAASAARS